MSARLGKFYLGRECYAMGLTHPILALEYNDLRSRFSDPALGHNVLVHMIQPLLTMPCGRYAPGKIDLSNGPLQARERWDLTETAAVTHLELPSTHFTICHDEGILVHTGDAGPLDNVATFQIDGNISGRQRLTFNHDIYAYQYDDEQPLPGRAGATMVYVDTFSIFVPVNTDSHSFNRVKHPVQTCSGAAFRNEDGTITLFEFGRGPSPMIIGLDGTCIRKCSPRECADNTRAAWKDPRGADKYVMIRQEWSATRAICYSAPIVCTWSPETSTVKTNCTIPSGLMKLAAAGYHNTHCKAAMDGAGRWVCFADGELVVQDLDTGKTAQDLEIELLPLADCKTVMADYSVHVDAMGRIVVFYRCGKKGDYHHGVQLIY